MTGNPLSIAIAFCSDPLTRQAAWMFRAGSATVETAGESLSIPIRAVSERRFVPVIEPKPQEQLTIL